MATQYEQAVTALAEASEAKIEIGSDRVATMTVEARVVLLKPSDEAESGLTAFSIVAGSDGGRFSRGVLQNALSLSLFGAKTGKGHIGLFGDSLFLSKDIALDGVTTEALAEKLLSFSRLADEIEGQLAADGGDGAADGDAETLPAAGGFGGFMQV